MSEDKELKNSIKGFKELFDITGHPVFGAIYLYEQRTHNIVKLDGATKEQNQEYSEQTNNEISI